MQLIKLYEQKLKQKSLLQDELQILALKKLSTIENQLYKRLNTPWHKKILKTVPICGLYMYGGVGRGKTFLMDLFFENINIENKQRVHYHALMQQIHAKMNTLASAKDPVKSIVKGLKSKVELLCLDELFVKDIGDAMIMAELMAEIRKQNIVLVITSNSAPDDLYKYGLQRSRFLPAIEHIKNMTEMFDFASDTDYRLQKILKNHVFFPHDDNASKFLAETFADFSKNQQTTVAPYMVGNREIISILRSPSEMWISFDELCNRPHGQNDYLQIAKNMQHLLIENIPALTDEQTDQVARFINLIDVCYDNKVKLIATLQTNIDEIYTGQSLKFDFARTQSRLMEMKSRDYWLG